MGKIDTAFLLRCISALERASLEIGRCREEDLEYDIYCSAIIKEFEIVLEQSGKLLKKILKPYFHSPKAVDRLYFKDLFREAGLRGIIEVEEVERWCQY